MGRGGTVEGVGDRSVSISTCIMPHWLHILTNILQNEVKLAALLDLSITTLQSFGQLKHERNKKMTLTSNYTHINGWLQSKFSCKCQELCSAAFTPYFKQKKTCSLLGGLLLAKSPVNRSGSPKGFSQVKISHTSQIQYKTCTLLRRKTYKHNPKGSPFGIALVKNNK